MRPTLALRNFWSKQIKSTNFGLYEIVKPGLISPARSVPDHIPKPCYYETGVPEMPPLAPEVKTREQILRMRDSCKLAAEILQKVGQGIHVGQTTDEIDGIVHELTIKNHAYPSPLNYKFFPKSVCTSVNNVACHGIPDDRPLKNGDIINVDITVFLNGYHGDCSKTFLVGQVDELGVNLVKATEKCLEGAIKICKPGQYFREIGCYIESTANEMGYKVVAVFLGHGIGSYFHGPPDIFHSDNRYPGKMQPGMTFTIEPILSQGDDLVGILEDDWTAITVDGSRTAQFEHTILVTDTSAVALTVLD